AGLAAAMYCARFEKKVVCFDPMPGGTITLTHLVENYPPIKSISGLELGQKFLEHATSYNTEIMQQKVLEIKKENEKFLIIAEDGQYWAKAIIYATGAKWKRLGLESEEKFLNKGIHFCASCDGPLYKEKVVVVIGSGDSAAKESVLLAEYAKVVYILIRGDRLKGEPINNKRAKENPKIQIFTQVEVVEFIGDKKLQKIKLSRKIKPKEYDSATDLIECSAAFIMIGHEPNTEIAKNLGVELNSKREIKVDKLCRTNVDGFFAAGDCTDIEFKQAIVSAGQGVLAAYSATEYLKKFELK
ncbi:MAG: NAD(P)/FAD-dependent oxidoreductase, partial [Candidatus Micrarchaeota archaeon]|nr:NAD(P)/FAD-dependent oxidoreductase [Candidatus Micrarchaeota archaeon]